MCRQDGNALLVDALWASRALFRRRGARKSTFLRRIQDPEYGARELAVMDLCRARLEQPCSEVSGEPFALDGCVDALRRARAELGVIRSAEEEISSLE